MTTLPAKLKQADSYSTHMVGRWHEGFFSKEYLPINRGCDMSSGFLTGSEDHMNELKMSLLTFGTMMDLMQTMEHYYYDAYIYSDDLTSIVSKHDPNTPFFLYLPLHNVHSPFEAPNEWLNIYPENSTCIKVATMNLSSHGECC